MWSGATLCNLVIMAEFKHSTNLLSSGTDTFEDDTASNSNNPVDTFEQAFQACLSAMTKEDTLSNLDRDEIKVDADLTLHNFIESARSMEGYFLKKRLQIAVQKPELLVKDDTSELRLELMRKDELLKKNFDKISHWQSMLSDLQPQMVGKLGPATPGAISSAASSVGQSGPLTPMSGRPLTPASVGRPQTPITSSGQMNPNTGRMMGSPSPNVGYNSPMSQGQQQPQPSGLQGPLAYLEKIGMNENR